MLGKIQGVYVEDPNLSKVMHGALLGLLESLDPYSTYLTAEEYSRYRKTGTSGDGDIGLDLSKERSLGYIWVIHPIEGSAAAESGVKPGDIIESIDGVTTRNIGLVQAGYLLSGDVGSKVELKIRRLGRSEPVLMSVSRERNQPPSVRGRLLKDDIGYLRIPRFVEGVSADAREKLKSLEAQGARKLVLDLRDCGGEAFEEGVGVANLFLDHGVIAYSEGQQSPQEGVRGRPGQACLEVAAGSASEPGQRLGGRDRFGGHQGKPKRRHRRRAQLRQGLRPKALCPSRRRGRVAFGPQVLLAIGPGDSGPRRGSRPRSGRGFSPSRSRKGFRWTRFRT